MHVSNLIKPGSFENQSLPAPSSSFSEYSAEHPVISRRIEVERTRNFYTRVAVHRLALPRIYLPTVSLSLSLRDERERTRGSV